MIGTILVVFAFVLACVAAAQAPPLFGRLHAGWLALAFYFLAVLLRGAGV